MFEKIEMPDNLNRESAFLPLVEEIATVINIPFVVTFQKTSKGFWKKQLVWKVDAVMTYGDGSGSNAPCFWEKGTSLWEALDWLGKENGTLLDKDTEWQSGLQERKYYASPSTKGHETMKIIQKFVEGNCPFKKELLDLR